MDGIRDFDEEPADYSGKRDNVYFVFLYSFGNDKVVIKLAKASRWKNLMSVRRKKNNF